MEERKSATPEGAIIGLETRARRISRWVTDRLAGGGALGATVASVHARVANLRLESGEFVCAGAAEVPLAANALSIDLPPDTTLRALGLEAGQPAAVSDTVLTIASRLRIRLAGARRWEPRPRPARTSRRELAHGARRARALAVAEGTSTSLLRLLWASGDAGALPEPARSAALPSLALWTAAVKGDLAGVERASARLAGLGLGLTPSGDDYLAGFAAAWVLATEALGGGGHHDAEVPHALAAGAAPGASPLGHAWIAHATRGEVAEPMTRFFGALLGGRLGAPALTGSARGVLGLGASSGTDWMVGALAGVEAALAALASATAWN